MRTQYAAASLRLTPKSGLQAPALDARQPEADSGHRQHQQQQPHYGGSNGYAAPAAPAGALAVPDSCHAVCMAHVTTGCRQTASMLP
jgi:hypothetical protein